jgi:hypothetical protein
LKDPVESGERKLRMNELSHDGNYNELKAELLALRKKLEDLETKQATCTTGTDRAARRRFPKRLVTTCVCLAALLVAGGALWGAEAIKALFVDSKGNVGIGTIQPSQKLDVMGTTVTDGVALSRDNAHRYAIFFANQGDFNHALYNDLSNIDGDGTKDEIKWNSVSGFDFRVGQRGKTSALFIGDNGGVGIGTQALGTNRLTVDGTLNVLKNASFGGALMVPAGNVGLGVNKRPEELAYRLDVNGSVNASENLSVGNVLTANRIGIGKAPDQEAALDVAGQIRGKPWIATGPGPYGQYEWRKDQKATRMTRVDRSVCFLTAVSAVGAGEQVWINQTTENGQTYWALGGGSGGWNVWARAICIGAPDNTW